MPDSAPQQLLHLVIGGELIDLEHNIFKDLDQVDIVGVFPELRDRPCGLEGQGAGRPSTMRICAISSCIFTGCSIPAQDTKPAR